MDLSGGPSSSMSVPDKVLEEEEEYAKQENDGLPGFGRFPCRPIKTF